MRWPRALSAGQRRGGVAVLVSAALHTAILLGPPLPLPGRMPLADNRSETQPIQVRLHAPAGLAAFNPEPAPKPLQAIRTPASASLRAARHKIAQIRPALSAVAATPAARIPQPVNQVVASHNNPSIPASVDAPPLVAQSAPESTTTESAPANAVSVDIRQAQPDYAYNPRPEYPLLLRDQGIGGVVWLRVRVDADGSARDISLLKGSGFRLLDEAALNAVRQWRFIPARHGEQTLASWVEFPIRFSLQG